MSPVIHKDPGRNFSKNHGFVFPLSPFSFGLRSNNSCDSCAIVSFSETVGIFDLLSRPIATIDLGDDSHTDPIPNCCRSHVLFLFDRPILASG